MKEIFKQLIVDFHKTKVPKPTPREIEIPELAPSVRKAFVYVGMRRSGKTWTLFQQIHTLLNQNIPQTKIIYINFEDDRLQGLKTKDLQSLLDAYYELYPQNVDAEDLYFFFDEIHEAPGWEKFIRRLLDQEKMTLHLTGSSAKLLSKEIASSLRGRTIVREIFPFNFREYLAHKQSSISEHLTSKEKAVLFANTAEFIKRGGFPETVGTTKEVHRELLQGYIDTVIYRDIIERYQVTNIPVLKRLLSFCLQNAASLFSVNKMYQTMKSLGYSTSKNSLYEFMDYYEDAYCIFSVDSYGLSQRKTAQKPKKVYPVDQGLITAYSINHQLSQAALLETIIFSTLRRSSSNIYYYHTKTGREVDFLITDADTAQSLVQVTLSLKDEKTKHREITALQEAMNELELSQGSIITLEEEEETITSKQGTIDCIPLWKFLLKSPKTSLNN